MSAMTFAVFSIGPMLVENGKAADVSNDLRNPLNWNTLVEIGRHGWLMMSAMTFAIQAL